jgi:glyoxylase-like metal-dependent hydrolase (beta-lactamase superfamily II)
MKRVARASKRITTARFGRGSAGCGCSISSSVTAAPVRYARPVRARTTASPVRTLIALAALTSGCPPPTAPIEPIEPIEPTSGAEDVDAAEELVITVIDVGQGDCTLVECPNGAEIVIDCGSSGGGDRDRIAALFDARLDGDIEVLVVTHPDADHINYLAPARGADGSVLGERVIGRALLSLDESAYRESATGRRLMDWLGAQAHEIEFLESSDTSPEGEPSTRFDCGDTAVYILAASEPSQSSERALQRNTPSIVLMLERELENGERFRAMLAGDATRETEAAILARYSDAFLDVDLLKVGHHGALTSTIDPSDPGWRWLSATTPRYAITTAGHHAGHRHPRCAVSDAIVEADSLEPYACHETECAETDACGGATDPPWCTSATALALFNSANNGDVSCVVGSHGASFSIGRGARAASECE